MNNIIIDEFEEMGTIFNKDEYKIPRYKRRALIKKKRGCPANNTNCAFLIKNKCTFKNPDLCYYSEARTDYCCGSFKVKI